MRTGKYVLQYFAVFTLFAVAAFAQTSRIHTSDSQNTNSNLRYGVHGAATQQAQNVPSANGAGLKATLLNESQEAKKFSAEVKVDVTGLQLSDPASTGYKPAQGQGHINYKLDDNPIISTTATRLDFHGLVPGEHVLVVSLSGNDNTPLGPQQTLTIKVPQ